MGKNAQDREVCIQISLLFEKIVTTIFFPRELFLRFGFIT